MKKLLALVLALVMTLSLAVSANAAFEDAKDINATYAEVVDVLAGMKVFQGYDNGKTFKPQGDITRAEVAAIVYRIYTADVKDSYVKNYETYKTNAVDAKDVNLTIKDGKAEAALTGTDKLASLTYAAEDHNAYVETPNQNEWLVVKNDDASKVYLKGVDEDVIYQVGKYTVTSAAESFNRTITVTAEDGVTTETYTIKVANTAHSCANVAVKEGLKFGLAWGGENNADLVLNLNGNKTLTGADLKAAIYVPCTVDTGKVCEGATIVIYDTIKDADHILKDGQDLVAMKGASDLFAVVTAANGQTWSFNITIAD